VTCNPNTLKPVKYGQKGKDVKNLQACLIEAGYNISTGANGYYGIQTKNAVKKFYSEWYKGKWTGNRIDAKGIAKLKEKLLSKKIKPGIIAEGKIRKFKLKESFNKILLMGISPLGKYVYITYDLENPVNQEIYINVQINDQLYQPVRSYGGGEEAFNRVAIFYYVPPKPLFGDDDKSYVLEILGENYYYVFDGSQKWVARVYRSDKDKKYYVQIKDKIYGPYEWAGDLKILNGGKIYLFSFQRYGKYYIQINDKTYGPADNREVIISSNDYSTFAPVVSKDYSKFGWVFEKDGKYYVQINDKTHGPYDKTYAPYEWASESVKFSDDGSRYGWIFSKDRWYYVQINDEILGPYEKVDYLSFSSNGASFGIVFQKDNYKYIQINKDEIYGPYERIEGGVDFSKDGSNYGWVFIKNEKCYVQIKEKIYGPHAEAISGESCFISHPYDEASNLITSVLFSENGSKYGWVFSQPEEGLFVQVNDKTYGPYGPINLGKQQYYMEAQPADERFDAIQFSKDGSKYGWAYYKENDWYVVLNDKIYGPYDYASGIIFSNDGSKYGWEFDKGKKKYIQINDKIYGPYDYATFTFTKDNKAYIAYISGNELVIEEVE
jgi:hypothetical protein